MASSPIAISDFAHLHALFAEAFASERKLAGWSGTAAQILDLARNHSERFPRLAAAVEAIGKTVGAKPLHCKALAARLHELSEYPPSHGRWRIIRMNRSGTGRALKWGVIQNCITRKSVRSRQALFRNS